MKSEIFILLHTKSDNYQDVKNFSRTLHLKISDCNYTTDIPIITFACKSDNWRSVENITLENFRFHTFACKSDNQKSVENITLENFKFHTACKSDNWRSVENIT